MPTISIDQTDFERLLRRPVGAEPLTERLLESWLPLVKGELKERDADTGQLRIELQDSNRPDLWSCEGIARQIRAKIERQPPAYAFFQGKSRTPRRIAVSPGLDQVRPYVAGCAAIGYQVTEPGLAQLIQVQEKLADIFGRKRQTVSIGLYRLPAIVFPVTYTLTNADAARFTPL